MRTFRSGFSLYCHRDNLWWSCSTWPWHDPLTSPSLQPPVSADLCSALLFLPLQRVWATWQQALELVSIRVMYSAPFSRLPSRAANFLLLGYTNCSISILYWAAAGSWGSTRHQWPVQAIVITTPQRPSLLLVWVSHPCAASVLTAFILLFLLSYPDLSVKGIHGSYFLFLPYEAQPPVDLASQNKRSY